MSVPTVVHDAEPRRRRAAGVDAASAAAAVRPVLEPVLVELPGVAVEPCDGTLFEAPEPVAVVDLPLPVAEVRPPPLPPRRQESVSGWLLSAIRRWTGRASASGAARPP